MEFKRPMLAVALKKPDYQKLRFPYLASKKIDGIRGTVIRGRDGLPVLVSRKKIKIPNLHTQRLFAREEFMGLDGELAVGPPNAKDLMQRTLSGIMSEEGEPDVTFHVFDKWDKVGPYYLRAVAARERLVDADKSLAWVSHTVVNNLNELERLEDRYIKEGYEGMMLREPHGPYKMNRSTLREGYLLKVKRFEDTEAEVIGTYEQERNENEATVDETGYTKRSHHQAGKVGKGVLGGLELRDLKTGIEFKLGTGFTDEQRRNLWEGRKYLIGKIVTYRHFPITGVKDKPRQPRFKCFRDRRDM